MSGFSPKISAATVAAGASTVVGGIVGPYVFPSGVPTDVQGLWLAAFTAAVTFASGYLTRHPADAARVGAVVKDAEKVSEAVGVPFSQIAEYVEPLAADASKVAAG